MVIKKKKMSQVRLSEGEVEAEEGWVVRKKKNSTAMENIKCGKKKREQM